MKTFDETNGSASVEETIPLISPVAEDNEEKKRDEEDKEKYANIRTENIGVWRIFYQDTPWSFLPGAETARKFRELVEGVPYVWLFLKEVWKLAPGHLILWALISIWESTQGAISLWVTAQILQTMQNIILSGKGDMKAVRYALAIKFLHGVSEIVHRWISDKCHKTLKRRISRHCGSHLLDVYARMDLVTLQRKDVQNKLSKTSNTFLGDAIWRSFCELMEQVTGVLEIASQGWFLASFFRTQENGWILAAVCVLPQVVQGIMYSDKFGGVWFAHAVNKAYLRVRSVGDTVRNKEFFEEIISSGLYQYLREEYHKGIDALGDVSDSHVYHVMWDERSRWKDFVNVLLHDASLVYYLMAVAINPSSFSLTSLTVMRESANSFAWTIWRLFERDNSLNEKIRFIQDYYSLLALKAEVVDGYLPYPAPEAMELEGMKLEFRNVSMKYPKSTNFALKNVSFTIPAGATVILVGANGSGKTTTVSLLSRLLDATSGEILVDDRPIKDYEVFTLRDAQAVLRQSYQHFPFSVKENIGMGDPRWLKDDEKALGKIEDRVMRAAKLGGADEIIEEIRGLDKKRGEVFKNVLLPKDGVANGKPAEKEAEKETEGVEAGWDINVTPVTTWEGSWQLHGSKLSDMSEEVEKTLDLSGGQWQRLALARLFMRAERERIRLVCTDEPSAALDPRAEFEIFQRLRNLKGRKTTKIFITHRFGHLTKHADLILCLKKGELVEAGTHEDLIKVGGEYATLYNIQAQAFQTS